MLLGLAGSLLKTLGKKKSKKNGKQVADSITNQPKNEVDKSQNPTTVHESGADLKPLEDVRDDIQASSKKKKDPLNLALDGIDNALFGIIDTLTETNILRKKIKSDAAKAQLDKKKSLREKVLESGLVKGAVGSVKKSVGNAWDKMMQFLTWTLMGAIVNAIVKNWDEIQKEIQKLVDDLKDLWDSPILKIFREFAMWIMVKGFQLTKLILPKDIDKMKEDTDKLKKELGVVEDQYKDIDKKIKNGSNNDPRLKELREKLESAKSDEERNEIMESFIDDNQNVIDPKTFIEDPENPGEKLRVSETFPDGPPQSLVDEAKSLYYIDQNGSVRRKSDNKKAEWEFLRKFSLYNQVQKEALERRVYNQSNNSSLTNQSNTTLLNNDISSYSLGIYEYSDLSEVFGTTNIFITGDSDSSINNTSSSGSLVFSSSSSLGVSIKEAQLLNIDSK